MSKGRSSSNSDWRDQLNNYKCELEQNLSDEEKQRLNEEKESERKRKREFEKRKKDLYDFLTGYKQNSGIFINNFFRKRDFKTYCMDKFHEFDFDINGLIPNLFDDPLMWLNMTRYLDQLEENKFAYHPISREYIDILISVSEVFDLLPRLEEDTIVYRGCSTLERNGVNGIVSTTPNRVIAEQFSRGTILKIHVPKGTKYIDIRSIRPKKQQRRDLEEEYILPPCDYTIISSKVVKKGREPNNHTGTTNIIELEVKPLDLLEEFLKVMEDPPEEYIQLLKIQGEQYDWALGRLQHYIAMRNQNKIGIQYNKK